MLIYGNTPKDIMAMIWRRRYKFISVFVVLVIAVMLTGCGSTKRDGSMSEFWRAVGNGDISAIKERFKSARETNDGSWDQVE